MEDQEEEANIHETDNDNKDSSIEGDLQEPEGEEDDDDFYTAPPPHSPCSEASSSTCFSVASRPPPPFSSLVFESSPQPNSAVVPQPDTVSSLLLPPPPLSPPPLPPPPLSPQSVGDPVPEEDLGPSSSLVADTKASFPSNDPKGDSPGKSPADDGGPPPPYTEGYSPLESFTYVMAAAGGASSIITQVQQTGGPPINTLGGMSPSFIIWDLFSCSLRAGTIALTGCSRHWWK